MLMTFGFISLLLFSVLYFCVSGRFGWARLVTIVYLLVLYAVNIVALWARAV
jgi:hypothetical protein